MTVSTQESKLVMNIIKSCNELINGKFILADNKISKILKNITESKDTYNLMSECLQNFNFEKEFVRAKIKTPTKPGYFRVPEEKYKLLPMVFCVLVDVESRKIDFSDFLKEYFKSNEPNNCEYKNFADQLIMPFRDAICEIFELPVEVETIYNELALDEDEEQKFEEKLDEKEEELHMEELENKFYGEVKSLTEEMIAIIGADKKIKEDFKQNALIMLSGIIRCCEIKDLKILNALIVGFDKISTKIKSVKFIYDELKICLINFYENL